MGHSTSISLHTIRGIPEIQSGDDLSERITHAIQESDMCLEAGDILVVAHKIVSKAEGRVVSLSDIQPSAQAYKLAEETGKPAAKIECILRESSKILRIKPKTEEREAVIICEHRLGLIMANAGIDESNVPGEDRVVLLPENPDHSARRLRDGMASRNDGIRPGVIISDTFGRPWRMGLVNVAIGLAGVPGAINLAGQADSQGRMMRATVPAFADEVAAAAGLLMDKTAGTPVILFRGLQWAESNDDLSVLLRPAAEDLFR